MNTYVKQLKEDKSILNNVFTSFVEDVELKGGLYLKFQNFLLITE